MNDASTSSVERSSGISRRSVARTVGTAATAAPAAASVSGPPIITKTTSGAFTPAALPVLLTVATPFKNEGTTPATNNLATFALTPKFGTLVANTATTNTAARAATGTPSTTAGLTTASFTYTGSLGADATTTLVFTVVGAPGNNGKLSGDISVTSVPTPAGSGSTTTGVFA